MSPDDELLRLDVYSANPDKVFHNQLGLGTEGSHPTANFTAVFSDAAFPLQPR